MILTKKTIGKCHVLRFGKEPITNPLPKTMTENISMKSNLGKNPERYCLTGEIN